MAGVICLAVADEGADTQATGDIAGFAIRAATIPTTYPVHAIDAVAVGVGATGLAVF